MQATFLPHEHTPAAGRLALYECGSPGEAGSIERGGGLRLPAGQPATVRIACPQLGGDASVRSVRVTAVALGDALPALLALPLHGGPAGPACSDSLRAWALAARLGLSLVRGRRLLPDLIAGADQAVHARWRTVLTGDDAAQEAAACLAAAMPPAAHAIAVSETEVWAADALVSAFFDAVADLAARSAAPQPRAGRPRARLLPWTARWAEALADSTDSTVPLGDDAQELLAGVASWHASAAAPDSGEAPKAQLRLRTPPAEGEAWRVELAALTGNGERVPADEVWSGEAAGAAALQEALLRGLARAARLFAPLDRALREAAPEQVELTVDEAWELLHHSADLMGAAGISVVLPDGLDLSALRLRLRVGEESGGSDAAVAVRWEAVVADDPVSPDELADILDAHARLVRWRGRWVQVDQEFRGQARLLERRDEVSVVQGLALALAGFRQEESEQELPAAEVVAAGRIAALLDGVRSARQRPPTAPAPEGFDGQLRPYQQRGVAWLHAMGSLGLGAVLADDMGLGKTVQLIAYLLARAEDSGQIGPWLVVCPTSVLGNWQREIARFAPKLPVIRHHGPQRAAALSDAAGVVLTSYGTLRRDADALADVEWDVVTLDEAQQVKNPGTVGAGAVRRLRSRQTVALTGTPLENRLEELWALMDATNPGLLGSRAGFARRFVMPIERRRDAEAARRLRTLIAPLMLRREKSDPEVAADLPAKIERTVVCAPTSEQVRLYQQVVDRTLSPGGSLAGVSSIQRRGRILALLTQLKQICNHPAQYLREDAAPGALTGRSGKLAALCEIVGEAAGSGDRIIVFTQYVVMGKLLVRQLADELGVDAPFLHGGTPAGSRDDMVARFQDDFGPPVLVVSLRAGGAGLNLTAASHVVHYDRWWNPAVEDQATDRAHRIGQTRTVEVHRLVTAGTLEERIAELLERKRSLASTVVGAGETWITELSDESLQELVSLADDLDVTDPDDLDEGWEAAG